MVKLQETKGRYFLSIPKNIVQNKGWGKGEDLIIVFNENGDVILRSPKRK